MDGVAILRFLATHEYAGRVMVLRDEFADQRYAIGLPEDSDLEEPLDREILDIIAGSDWAAFLVRYFGQ